MRTDHRALQWLFYKKLNFSASISNWLATLMEYPMQIEYMRSCKHEIVDALYCLDLVKIESEVLAELTKNVPSYACLVAETDGLDARTD